MKNLIISLSVGLLFLMAGPLSAQEETTTTREDQTGLSVTIYNQNMALIKDQRTVEVPQGTHVLAFREVSGQIQPETALLAAGNLSILEQNFEFDLLTPQALLEKYVGRQVKVLSTHPTTGEETLVDAKVLSAQSGVVLQIGDRIETGVPGRLVFPDVPDNLRDRPTLTMLVNSDTNKKQDVELSYLTGGLSWKADYVAELNADDSALNLSGWVTLNNQSGASYYNAQLQLVAGDVHRAPPEYGRGGRMYKASEVMSLEMADNAMSEEQMFEYHLYTLGRVTTIKDNQSKQVALMQASDVPCEKEFLLAGNSFYYRNRLNEHGEKLKIAVFVSIDNKEKNNLGMPLPKGIIRVYKNDSQSRLQFVGEDRIDHTPENETIRLKLGDSFDVTAHKKQTDFKKISGSSRDSYVYESTYSIEIKNGKAEDLTVKVLEPVPGDWTILQESLKHKKASSNSAVWQVPVKAKGSTTLTYKVRVTY
ncbi:MAG: DUF4139 domain-containing protein [bacterium]|nr:DUF4139 domain-containing protein [bacterium]